MVLICPSVCPLSLSSSNFPLRSVTELPGPPTNMAISNIGPRSVTLQFKPGYDGKTSISRWQVEAQVSQDELFLVLGVTEGPDRSLEILESL